MLKPFRRALGAALLAATLAAPALAQTTEIRAGMRAEPTIDPHVLFLTTNIAYARHMFEALVDFDADMNPIGVLATSWRTVDDTTWEFKLRQGVKFHDGSDFTAADVKFTVERLPAIPNNPNSYVSAVRGVVGVDIVDAHTVRFRTDRPNPTLPKQMSIMSIVSHTAAAGASPSDFASGKAAVGTGPYRFASFAPGSQLVLTRFDGYWGDRRPWERITFRVISSDASRISALLAGDVDIVDFVPPTMLPTLQGNQAITVTTRPSARVIYLAANQGPDRHPEITDRNGAALDRNPLKDLRVRQAISMAIDRSAIARRTLEGMAEPASQMASPGILGYEPAIPVQEANVARARQLLAEAGYADGFGITVTCPNNRYIRDGEICQVVGQFLTRIGLVAKVQTMPLAVFFPRIKAPNNEFALILAGWGNTSTAETDAVLSGVLHSFDTEKNLGTYNNANFSNPQVDALVERAITEMDEKKREAMLREAIVAATTQLGTIPLHVEKTAFAARRGIAYTPRIDERAMIMDATPAR